MGSAHRVKVGAVWAKIELISIAGDEAVFRVTESRHDDTIGVLRLEVGQSMTVELPIELRFELDSGS